jgi:hypothetical protein
MRREDPATDVQDIVHVRENRARCVRSRIPMVLRASEDEEARPCRRAQLDAELPRLYAETRVRNAPERSRDGRGTPAVASLAAESPL